MAEATDTCTIEVGGIPRELLAVLDRRVRALGSTREGYIRRLIEKDLSEEHRATELERILSPVHKESAASGATEEEITNFLEDVREQAWRERHPEDARAGRQ